MAVILLGRRGIGTIGESAFVMHLARRTHEGAQRRARKRAANADALDADGGQFLQAKLHAGKPHHHIDRTAERTHQPGNVLTRAQAGRIKHIRANFLKGWSRLMVSSRSGRPWR